jgi:hypothetical protein
MTDNPIYIMNRALLICFLLSIISSCSKTPTWLKGKFEFDMAATTKQLSDAEHKAKANNKHESLLGSVVVGLALSLAPGAIEQKHGGTILTISDTDFATVKGGTGSSLKFEVFEAPTADSISIKLADGKIETWTQTPTGIMRKAEGTVPFLLHYKRVATP